MKIATSLLTVSVFIAALCLPIVSAGEDPIVAKVGDIEIRQSEIDHKLEEIPPYARTNFETAEGQKKLLNRIIRTKVLTKAAIDAGYMKDEKILRQIEEAKDRILSSAYFQDNMSIGPMPSEKEMINFYEDNKDEKFKVEASADIQQIVLKTKDEAKQIKQKLDSGEIDFNDAVNEYSIDESKSTNGLVEGVRETGFIRGIGRSKPLIDTVFKLKANEISEPIETRRGFHLVKLVKKTNEGYQDFETVKSAIAKELMVSLKEIQAEYLEHQSDYQARARCKISHILLNTQEEAEQTHEKLRNGEDFIELVKSVSIDYQSRKEDGNLGYLYKGGYIRGVGKDVEFENAVFELAEGSVSRPIKSKKGWHIVKIMEKEEEAVKPLMAVEEQIRQKLITEKKDNFLESKFEKLEKKYKVKILEENIKSK